MTQLSGSHRKRDNGGIPIFAFPTGSIDDSPERSLPGLTHSVHVGRATVRRESAIGLVTYAILSAGLPLGITYFVPEQCANAFHDSRTLGSAMLAHYQLFFPLVLLATFACCSLKQGLVTLVSKNLPQSVYHATRAIVSVSMGCRLCGDWQYKLCKPHSAGLMFARAC